MTVSNNYDRIRRERLHRGRTNWDDVAQQAALQVGQGIASMFLRRRWRARFSCVAGIILSGQRASRTQSMDIAREIASARKAERR